MGEARGAEYLVGPSQDPSETQLDLLENIRKVPMGQEEDVRRIKHVTTVLLNNETIPDLKVKLGAWWKADPFAPPSSGVQPWTVGNLAESLFNLAKNLGPEEVLMLKERWK